MIRIIIVGFVAGIIARLLSPGPNNPSGFILTTVLGIAGAFLATFVGQAIGHYEPRPGRGLSSPRPSARWWCCSSGTGWWRSGVISIRDHDDGTSRHSGRDATSIEPAIATFRVSSFGPSRNDTS